MIIIERNVNKIAFFGVALILLSTALFIASSAAEVLSADARSNFASPPDSAAVDEEDTFDHDHFEDPKKMRVILGDTSGWVNPHDKMGSPQRRQKAKQQFLNRQRQRQKQLADPSLRESDPISEDTASSETRAKLYSQLRARSAANGRTFSRLPTQLDDDDDDDSGAKEEPVAEEAAPPKAAAASTSCDCDCKALKRTSSAATEQIRVLRLNQVVADRLALNVVYSARYGRGDMTSNVKLEILLSPEDVASLEELAQQTETQSAQLEQQLSAMLASSTVTPFDLPAGSAADTLLGRLAQRWAALVGPAQPAWAIPGLAALAILALVGLRGAPWKAWVGACLLYFFLLSFVWHWVYSLQLETARRDAFVSRNIVPPEECSPGYSPGWLRRLTSDDQVVCDRYYEKLQVDPVWQVNPLIVASDVLSRAFFHPLTFLGDYVGRFAQDFAKHQTFWSIFNNLLSLLILVVLGGVIFMFLFKVGIFLWVNYHGGQRVPPTHRSRVEDVPDRELGHVTEGSKRDEHLVLDRDRTKLDPHFDDRPVPDQGRIKPDSRDRSIPDQDPDCDEEGRRFEDAKTDESTAIDGSGDARMDDASFSEAEQT
ncbi:hypothetical protein HPB47_014282 [Ixodes persulcatus]|uniref:Uncharacterized protein n=1 Tax=Ixodes persulcatus TaxID=34615 RepID=A0AC60QWL3_IXOPE|nr:hypothetical protein HPB47_014282 [Ixodes persulcatus]